LMIPQPPDQGRITDDTHDQDGTPEDRQDQVPDGLTLHNSNPSLNEPHVLDNREREAR